MIITDLNEETFTMYSIKAYDSVRCVLSEYEEDLNRIKYIRRILKRYRETGLLKERLLINHIVILGNVFGVQESVCILLYKCPCEDHPALKTIFLFLKYLPKRLPLTIEGKDIPLDSIGVDLKLANLLRQI